MKVHRDVLLAGALLFAAVGAVLAGDNGTLIVKVLDENHAPFPGVAVAVENSSLLTAMQAKQTDGTGSATFILPSGGGYKVSVSIAEYNLDSMSDLKVEINRTKQLVFTMQKKLEVHVKVVAEKAKVVDVDEGATNPTTFTDAFVEDLPVLGRNYQSVLTLAPGVNDPNNTGNPNVHGARDRDFKATVDGVSNVDPLTGTFMSNINPDAIEEIEVVTTGASAEYGRAVGGYSKIITKQGGNTFDGVANFFMQSSLLDNHKDNQGNKLVYHQVQPSLLLSGPVVKDKIFFVLSHEYIDSGNPVDLLNGGSIIQTAVGSRNLDKLTWQASSRDKLIFQASSDPLTWGPLGIDSLTDPSSGFTYRQGGPTYEMRWNSQVSAVMNVESLLALSHTGISYIPNTNGIKNGCGVDQLALVGRRLDPFGHPGGEPIDEDYCFLLQTGQTSGSFFDNYNDDRIRYSLKSDATWLLDDFLGMTHTLKGGLIVEKERYEGREILRSSDVFSEALFLTGGPKGDSTIDTSGGTLTRQNYIPGLPNQWRGKADGTTFGLYIEDQFKPAATVVVRFGTRIEQEEITAGGYQAFDPKTERQNFDAAYTACVGNSGDSIVKDRCARANFHDFTSFGQFPVAGASPIKSIATDPTVGIQPRVPDRFRISNTNIGPRLSLSWDPRNDQKTKIFASANRIYAETFLLIPTSEQGPDNFVFSYDVTGQEQCRTNPDGDGTICLHIPAIGADNSAIVSPASIYQIDRNYRTPYVDEFTAGFSREIAQETSITFTAIRRHFRDQLQAIDVNHFARDRGTTSTYGCGPTPDGGLAPIDTRKDGIPDDCGGKTVQIPNPNPGPFDPPFTTVELPDGIPDLNVYNPMFNQVQRIGNYNHSNYTAYQIELVKRLHRNWQLEGSYVWSKAFGNAEDYISPLGSDPTTHQQEFGYLSYDQRHYLKVNVTTQIPVWNVRIGSAFRWASGLPYSITARQTSLDQPQFFGNFSVRYVQLRTIYPTHQRNDQRNPGEWGFDVSAKKDFTIGKTNLELNLDVFNLLNDNYQRIYEVRDGLPIATRLIGRYYQVAAKFSF